MVWERRWLAPGAAGANCGPLPEREWGGSPTGFESPFRRGIRQGHFLGNTVTGPVLGTWAFRTAVLEGPQDVQEAAFLLVSIRNGG